MLHVDAGVQEEHGLQRLVEGACRLLGDTVTDLSDLKQLLLAMGVAFVHGHRHGLLGIALAQLAQALADEQQRLQILDLLVVAGYGDIQLAERIVDPGLDALHALVDDHGVVRSQLTPAANAFPVNVQNAAVTQSADILRDLSVPLIIDGAALPIRLDELQERLAILVPQFERVIGSAVDRVDLTVKECPAVIRANKAASLLAAGVADDQLVLPNGNGLFQQSLINGIGLLVVVRLTLGLLECLRDNNGILDIDLRGCIQNTLFQPLNTLCVVFFVCHVNLLIRLYD